MSESDAAAAIIVLFFILIFFGGWAALVVFGIKAAKKKNRSPHWMWFGVHPLGALIVFIVMMVLEPLKLCPQCARPSPAGARLCPFCAYSFVLGAAPGAPPAA